MKHLSMILTLLMLGGCGLIQKSPGPEVATAVVLNTVPTETSLGALRDEINAKDIKISELIDGKNKLDKQRADIADKQARTQQDLDNAQAELKNSLQLKKDAQDARLELEAKQAHVSRAVLWALGTIGGLAVAGGALVAYFFPPLRRLGGGIAIAGIVLLLLVLVVSDKWVMMSLRIGVASALVLGVLALAGAVAHYLWILWKHPEAVEQMHGNGIAKALTT